MICEEDLLNGLLVIDDVLGANFKVFLATETIGDDEVAVTILPTRFSNELRLEDKTQFDVRLSELNL